MLNNQVWQLGQCQETRIFQFGPDELLDLALAHAAELDHVGFTETVEADCAFIFSRLGIPAPPEVPKLNVTDRRPPATNHSSRLKDLLDEATCLDRLLYDRIWASRRDCGAITDPGLRLRKAA